MGKATLRKIASPKKRLPKASAPHPANRGGVARPSTKALRVLLKFAGEDRTPRSWLEGTDDPTTAD